MTALFTPAAETIVGWVIVALASAYLLAFALGRAAGRCREGDRLALAHDATATDSWLDDYGPRVMYGADDLPIFGDATAAHIAERAAVSIDDEWAEVAEGRWGRG